MFENQKGFFTEKIPQEVNILQTRNLHEEKLNRNKIDK